MKRIYIDGLGILEAHFSGVGQYILGILRGIDEIIDDQIKAGEKPQRVTVIVPKDAIERFNSFGFKHIDYKVFPMTTGKMLSLWHRNKLPPIDLFIGRGVYIFPRFVSMRLALSKYVLGIFDLSYELHKEFVDDNNARFLSREVARSVNKASRIVTISQNTRDEIIDFYRVKPSEVSVATPAADQGVFYRRNAKEIAKAKKKYNISGDYILALSNLEPRKNLESLIRAYTSLPTATKKKFKLLVVGANGWKADKLLETIDADSTIIRPSEYVTDEDKPAIISGASLLVYPSHYEGFGMPPLEALACGVPVITADNSSLPEVVGSAGVMINSHDLPGLKQAITKQLKNIDTVTKKASKEGPERASLFSWKKSAQVFLDQAKDIS